MVAFPFHDLIYAQARLPCPSEPIEVSRLGLWIGCLHGNRIIDNKCTLLSINHPVNRESRHKRSNERITVTSNMRSGFGVLPSGGRMRDTKDA